MTGVRDLFPSIGQVWDFLPYLRVRYSGTGARAAAAHVRPAGCDHERVTVWRRYLLFQIPGWIVVGAVLWGLHHWKGLPWSTVALLYALYVIKDFALYPFLRRSYEQDPRSPTERLIGERGVVLERLAPEGFVRVRGEIWRAAAGPADGPVEAGRRVRVEDVDGLTLMVKAEG